MVRETNAGRTVMIISIRPFLLAAVFSLTATSAFAQIEDRLVVITSFAKEVTEPYVQAFQKKYPGTKVEMQNRDTAAAVTFVRESRSSPPDLLWASAPDAFEVLKKEQAATEVSTAGAGYCGQGRHLSGQ